MDKISKHTADRYVWGDSCDGWHLVRTEGLSVIHERMPAGAREVRHYHAKARQFFFVLSGTAVMETDGVLHRLLPQEGIEIPPLVPHQIRNESDEPVEFLVVSQPPTPGDRVSADEPEQRERAL